MKYVVSIPGTYGVVSVEAKDTLWAVMNALNPTVWEEEEFLQIQKTYPGIMKAEFFKSGYDMLQAIGKKGNVKIDHKEIIDTSFYSISGRMAALIEETLHRGRTILHSSITADQHRFYEVVIYQEPE